MNSSFFKILMFAAAVLLAGIWLKVVAATNWNLYGYAGVLFGLLPGITLCIANLNDRCFLSGVLAVAIAVAAFGIGDYQKKEGSRENIEKTLVADESFIMGLAEQKMLHRSPAFGGNPSGTENYADGVPMVSDSRSIPEGILNEATAEWNALPDTIKQQFRAQRVQVTQQSMGENFAQTATLSSWMMKIGMMSIVGVVAFVAASVPAILAMKK